MNKRIDRSLDRRGSVLILVVALLAVLFVAGIGFLVMTSNDRRSSAAGRVYAGIAIETDAALQAVVAEISRSQWQVDASGTIQCLKGWDYPYTNPAGVGVNDDAFLASTFSVGGNWAHISNPTGQAGFGRPDSPSDTNVAAASCNVDTDRDGINDAMWTLSPSGRYRVAYRVVDLSGMLNLNTIGNGGANSGTAPAIPGLRDDMGTTPYSVTGMAVRANGDLALDLANEASPKFGRNACGATDATLFNNPALDYSRQLDNPKIRCGSGGATAPNGDFLNAQPFRETDTLALLSYGFKVGPVKCRPEGCWPNTFSDTRTTAPSITTNTAFTAGSVDSLRMYYTATSATRDVCTVPATGAPPAGGPASWQGWLDIVNAYYGLPAGNQAVPAVNVNGTAAHGALHPHDHLYTRALVAAIVLSGAMTDADRTPLTQLQVEQLVVNIVNHRDSFENPYGNISRAGANSGPAPTNPLDSLDLVDTVFNSPNVYGVKPQLFITKVASSIFPVTPGTATATYLAPNTTITATAASAGMFSSCTAGQVLYVYTAPGVAPKILGPILASPAPTANTVTVTTSPVVDQSWAGNATVLTTYPSYAILLYNPYNENIKMGNWQIVTPGGTVTLTDPVTNPTTPSAPQYLAPGASWLIRNRSVYPPNPLAPWGNNKLIPSPGFAGGAAGARASDPNLIFGIHPAVPADTMFPGIPEPGDIYLLRPQKLGSPVAAGTNDLLVMDKVCYDNVLANPTPNTYGVCKAGLVGGVQLWGAPTSQNPATGDYWYRPDHEWMQSHDEKWIHTASVPSSWTASNWGTGYPPTSTDWATLFRSDGRELPIVASCAMPRGWPTGGGINFTVGMLVMDCANPLAPVVSNVYRCRVAHQSVGGTSLTTDPTKWEKVWMPAGFPAWVSTTAYNAGDIVQDSGGSLWKCVRGPTPTGGASLQANPGYWREYAMNAFDTLGQLHWMMLVGPPSATVTTVPGSPPVVTVVNDTNGNTAVATRISRNYAGVPAAWNSNTSPCLDFTNATRADSKVLKNLCRLDRLHDGLADNGSADPNDINKWRQFGKINVNTAPPYVLQALSYFMADPLGNRNADLAATLTFHTLIYNYRESAATGGKGFTMGIGQVMNSGLASTASLFSSSPTTYGALTYPRLVTPAAGGAQVNTGSYPDSVDNLRTELKFFANDDTNFGTPSLLPVAGVIPKSYWAHSQRAFNDVNQTHFLFDRISDVITTRSDTFLVYIVVEEMPDGANASNYWTYPPDPSHARRMVAIVDRSRCNYPPGNANYRSPEILARSIATW